MSNIVVPELGESVVEATVAKWLKKEGDPVAVGEPVVELETEKIDLEVGANHDGVLARIERRAGEDVKIGEVLGVIEAASGTKAETAPTPTEPKPAPQDASPSEKTRATPSARRVAAEREVDLTEVRGSGDRGRVHRQDVEAHGRAEPAAAAQPEPAPP